MSDNEEPEWSEQDEQASNLFKSSRRVAYVVDKWITGLYFDLLKREFELSPRHRSRMLQAVRDCELKLLALKYHVDNMKRLDEEFAAEDRKIIELTGATEQKSISIPINFELEAFLLQARACLEIFCQVAASRCQLSRIKPKNIAKVLAGHQEKFGPQVANHVKSHPFVWRILQGEEEGNMSLRDQVAHYSGLMLTGIHSVRGDDRIKYRGPMLSEEMAIPASVFAGILLMDLERFVKGSLAEIFDWPIPAKEQFLITEENLQ